MYEIADCKHTECKGKAYYVTGKIRYCSIDNQLSDIGYKMINRVDIEYKTQIFRETVNFVENSRHIHQKHGKNLIQILHIPEEYEQ